MNIRDNTQKVPKRSIRVPIFFRKPASGGLPPLPPGVNYIVTTSGDFIVTTSGDNIITKI